MKKDTLNKLKFLLLMAVFGCLGPIVRNISLPSSVIVCIRAWVASLTLLLYCLVIKKHWSREEIKKVLLPMFFSGLLICGDWIGLFASYNYTTIATATVCYYMSCIFVAIGSALLLNEKLSLKSGICVAAAFFGMVLVSGAAENGITDISEIKGILLALFGAVSYALIILLNKKYPEGDPLLRTTIQLSVAALFMTPYILMTNDVSALSVNAKDIVLLLILGAGLTALTYIFYFAFILLIPGRSIAIISFADPIVAVLVSLVFMGEKTTVPGIIGTVIIIGAAMISEI